MTNFISQPGNSSFLGFVGHAAHWLCANPSDSAGNRRQMAGNQVRELGHTLLRNLGWPGRASAATLKTIGVTSCYSGHGVSTIVQLMAATAASSGTDKVLVVDANVAQPNVHHRFAVAPTPGLSDVVLGKGPVKCALQPTRVANCWAIAAGEGEPAATYAAMDQLERLFAEFRAHFDLVVVDLPATTDAGPAKRLFGLLDGILVVLEDERVRREVAQRAVQDLERAGANILGVALNKRNKYIPDWLYRSL